jgi:hypothetical protein
MFVLPERRSEVTTASHLSAELKDELMAEARLVRSIRRGVGIEFARIQRAVQKHGMSVDTAMQYTKGQLEDYFNAELDARKVSR